MRSGSLALTAAGLMFACVPMQAHHSFAAEFDTKKPVELTGTVTSIEWVNPHAWNLANARTVKTIDGKRVFNAGSSGEPGTPGAPQSGAPQQ
jgi:hypothetical protein